MATAKRKSNKKPTAKQLAARRKFTQMVKARAKTARAAKAANPGFVKRAKTRIKRRVKAKIRKALHLNPGASKKANKTIIKAKRVTVLKSNAAGKRRSNKGTRLSASDIAKLPARVREQIEGQLGGSSSRGRSRATVTTRGTAKRSVSRRRKTATPKRRGIRRAFKTGYYAARGVRAVGRGIRRNTARRRKPNSSVGSLLNDFRGRPQERWTTATMPAYAPGEFAELGKLSYLKVKERGKIKRYTFSSNAKLLADGRKKLWISGVKFKRPTVLSNPDHVAVQGEITEVGYVQRKSHLGDSNDVTYYHKFGEDTGKCPTLEVDYDGFPLITGGAYKITSAGIEN